MAKKRDGDDRRVVGFLGVGLDNKDGEQRLTRSEHFFLIGGSDDTHGRMQETAIKFSEKLKEKGKKIDELPADQVIAIFHDSQE